MVFSRASIAVNAEKAQAPRLGTWKKLDLFTGTNPKSYKSRNPSPYCIQLSVRSFSLVVHLNNYCMSLEYIAKKSVTIPASAKGLESVDRSALIKQYFFWNGGCSKWKVGSPIVFKGLGGKPYEDKGTILALEKEALEVQYWSSFRNEDVAANYAKHYLLVNTGQRNTYSRSHKTIAISRARDTRSKTGDGVG